jgi:DNA-binding response OmpR family regulator
MTMKKILIIEDDQRLAFALSIRLKSRGYATWTAGDAIAAVAKAREVKPDLILLDLSLPAGSGFNVLKQLDQFPETCETPIILVTASEDPDLREKALDLGIAGLLRKPYDEDALASVVEQALQWNAGTAPNYCAPESPSTRMIRPAAPKKVLIIEDDQKVARALAIRMEAAGFETSVAYDGVSGVRSALNSKPDVIVLDISLPAGNGFLVAERIQAHEPHPSRIIFLTASKRPDFRQRAEQLGAVAFFEKPYEAESLVNAVHQAVA